MVISSFEHESLVGFKRLSCIIWYSKVKPSV